MDEALCARVLGIPCSSQSVQLDPSHLVFAILVRYKFLWQRGICPEAVCVPFPPSPESGNEALHLEVRFSGGRWQQQKNGKALGLLWEDP